MIAQDDVLVADGRIPSWMEDVRRGIPRHQCQAPACAMPAAGPKAAHPKPADATRAVAALAMSLLIKMSLPARRPEAADNCEGASW